ncbi:Hypothetical Protein FCC1311_034772 [Hondaea fermentalgiana]|uniref:Uncharacterized protein n=1 Tax=Hondaea fermentalgiana TaxID=2315210 RepID=A0A2R5G9M4_9STRA|nr:Hypothetical Protein FCC1311_034772 [Hondaea fermentalgiana]|eukprot:GBG27255.1 Hypothetical Protein FCC1311_034772 [Hondaea fermentalgiana]
MEMKEEEEAEGEFMEEEEEAKVEAKAVAGDGGNDAAEDENKVGDTDDDSQGKAAEAREKAELEKERHQAEVLQKLLQDLDSAIEDERAPASAVRIAAEKTRQWLVKAEAARRMELDKVKLARTARSHEVHIDLTWGGILRAGAVGKYLVNVPLLRVVTHAIMDLSTASTLTQLEMNALREEMGAALLISFVLEHFPRDRVLQREGLRAATNLACIERVRQVLTGKGCYRFAAEALHSTDLNDDRFLVEAALGAVANLAHEFAAAPGAVTPAIQCGGCLDVGDFTIAVESTLDNMKNYALAGSVQARALNALANTMLVCPGCKWDYELYVKCVLAAMRNFSETLNILQYGLMSIVNGLRAAARPVMDIVDI